jgi:hypothetical protein
MYRDLQAATWLMGLMKQTTFRRVANVSPRHARNPKSLSADPLIAALRASQG